MSWTKTTHNFTTISEARAYFIKQGYNTVDINNDSAIMSKHINGNKVGEVIINREAFMEVVAEALEKAA